MRFAASVEGLQEHRGVVQRELEALDQLIAVIESCESSATEFSLNGESHFVQVSSKLRRVRQSLLFRFDFLQSTADSVTRMVTRDQEILREMDGFFSGLEIDE
jgi:hypothetical protein